MIFLPGVAITNAVRDSLAGDLLAGSARAMEAMLIAVSIAAGVGACYSYGFQSEVLYNAISAILVCLRINGRLQYNIQHPPPPHIHSGFGGACGWLAYRYLLSIGETMVIACFIGACVVALLSEIFCRIFKEVYCFHHPRNPSSGSRSWHYNTMLSLLNQDFAATAEIGTQTILMAGSSSCHLIISSFIRAISFITNTFRG